MFQKLFHGRCGRWGLTASEIFRVAQWACVGMVYMRHMRHAKGHSQPLRNLVVLSLVGFDTFFEECHLPLVDEMTEMTYLGFQPHKEPASASAAQWELMWDCLFPPPFPRERYGCDVIHQVRMLAILGVASRLKPDDVTNVDYEVPRSVMRFSEACASYCGISLPAITSNGRVHGKLNMSYLVHLLEPR